MKVTRPEPMDHISPLFDREDNTVKEVLQSGIARDLNGVGTTDLKQPRIFSERYGSCTGLLIQNMDTGATTLFHFWPETITRGQVEALEQMRDAGGRYRGVFISGLHSKSPYDLQDMLTHGRSRALYTIEDFVNEYLPDITWNQHIELKHDTWSLGYDNVNRVMHIQDHDAKDQRWGQSIYYNYGDPFALTPAIPKAASPVSQVEPTGARVVDITAKRERDTGTP